PTATGNEVVGNYLGTDASGTRGLGNSYGVFISDTPGNTIGGTTAGAGNVISANDYEGVYVSDDGATANRILSNSIFNNAGLGIDLFGTDGPTPNDPGDPDTGPNNLQNFPVLTSAKTVSANTTIRGTLDSTPNKSFLIQFFSSPTPDPSGYGEGKRLLGQKAVTTDAAGKVSFTYTTPTGVPVGQAISATATGAANTSEFSRARLVVTP
ncbi:MAG: Calx-beta domain-containing protein, partial [Rubrobacter sp.]